jgi:uncharacterized coiled-coil protein SlyX
MDSFIQSVVNMESKYADQARWIEEHSEQVAKHKGMTVHISETGEWPVEWWNEALMKKHSERGIKDMSREYIDKPPHYNRGKIEVRDFIVDQQLCFQGGNVVKYVCRAGYKETTGKISDLRKAQNYLNKYIEYCEKLQDDVLNGCTEDIT